MLSRVPSFVGPFRRFRRVEKVCAESGDDAASALATPRRSDGKTSRRRAMNLIVFAMRKPITLVMVIAAVIGGGILAVDQMRVDIFPALNQPQIYVVNNFAGMDPSQIEGFMTTVYEQNFQYVDGLKKVESKNIQNLVLIKLTFYPGTDMAAAMSQVVSLASRARGQMPPSVLPPFVMRFDASNVPIGYLVLDSADPVAGRADRLGHVPHPPPAERADPRHGLFFAVRQQHPGDPREGQSRPAAGVQPVARGRGEGPGHGQRRDAVRQSVCAGADAAGADQRHGRRSPGARPTSPSSPGKNVYIRDVATIEDGTDINYGCALVNGRKSVYIPVVKKDTASTLTVVREINEALPLFRSVVPEDVQVRYEFDESPTVRAAIKSVATEGLIGAGAHGADDPDFPARSAERGRGAGQHPAGADRRPGGAVADEQYAQHHVAGRPGSVHRYSRRHGDRHGGEHPRPDAPYELDRPGGAAERHGHGLGAALGDALRPVGVHPDVHHEGAGPVALHAADARGGLRDGRLVRAVEHGRARDVGLADPAPSGEQAAKKGFFDRVLPGFGRIVSGMVRRRWLVVPAYLAACGLVLWLVGQAGRHGALSRRWMPASSCSAFGRLRGPSTS